jgi:hypothetical protein
MRRHLLIVAMLLLFGGSSGLAIKSPPACEWEEQVGSRLKAGENFAPKLLPAAGEVALARCPRWLLGTWRQEELFHVQSGTKTRSSPVKAECERTFAGSVDAKGQSWIKLQSPHVSTVRGGNSNTVLVVLDEQALPSSTKVFSLYQRQREIEYARDTGKIIRTSLHYKKSLLSLEPDGKMKMEYVRWSDSQPESRTISYSVRVKA